jgi:hypothetical protein
MCSACIPQNFDGVVPADLAEALKRVPEGCRLFRNIVHNLTIRDADGKSIGMVDLMGGPKEEIVTFWDDPIEEHVPAQPGDANYFHPNWKHLGDCRLCGEFEGHGHVCKVV